MANATTTDVDSSSLIDLHDLGGATTADQVRTRSFAYPIALFATTMFVASGLLFLVQPMFARMVLPRLGGSPSAWNACVLFFQTTLLLGYLYAHLSTRWLGVRRQVVLHATVLLLPLFFLPLSAGSGAPAGTENPVWWLLQTMAVTIGVPFFVLATSAPLLQRWFAVLPIPSARDPYFLYSASNLGSMLALLSYPFLIEPALGIGHQTLLWTGGYALLVPLTGICLWTARTAAEDRADDRTAVTVPPASTLGAVRRLRWVVFAFAPSSLMLGVTAHISTDVAAVPLMWVLPLALYLLTFVLAFSQRGAALHRWTRTLAPPLILACLITIVLNAHAWWFMALHLGAFFFCAMACHRELANARPPVAYLTEFYLWISFGGMLGGVFNTLIAPHVFSSVLEYPLVLALIGFLIPVAHVKRVARSLAPVVVGYGLIFGCLAVWMLGDPSEQIVRALIAVMSGVSVTLAISRGPAVFRPLSLLVTGLVIWGPPLSGGTALFNGRSFFGVMRVIEAPDHSHRILRHGSTTHGWQRIPAEGRCEASSYYHPEGPVGDMVKAFGPRLQHVGVVGLGTGAMACYAAPGQHWTFYEIDPLVERIARDASLFSHLQNAPGDVQVVIGDGRIMLQREPAGQFDLIVLDAFSSDSVPVHLLTQEAVRLYASRLTRDGLLAIHISNRYLALEPVVATLAAREGLFASVKYDSDISERAAAEGKLVSHWIVLSPNEAPTVTLGGVSGWREPVGHHGAVWTDDYSNIFKALR